MFFLYFHEGPGCRKERKEGCSVKWEKQISLSVNEVSWRLMCPIHFLLIRTGTAISLETNLCGGNQSIPPPVDTVQPKR